MACLAWRGTERMVLAEDFRASAAILDGVELTGSGPRLPALVGTLGLRR